MSYRPYNRNVSGIFYLGDQGADAPLQTTSDIIISDGGGANTYIQSANLVIADAGNIGSATTKNAIAIASNGNVTFDQSVSISQDLTVNGTLTTIATEYFTVQDPLIYLGSGNAADINDLGFFGEYSDDGGTTPEYAGLFRDASDEKFRLFHSLEEEPSTTVNTGGTGYTVATLVANLEGNVTGDLTGTADDATILETTRTFSITGEGTATTQNFNGSQNVALPFLLDETAITNQTEKAVAAVGADQILIIDSEDSSNFKRITRANFISGLGGFSNFVVTDSGGVQNVVDDGEVLEFQDGTTVTFTVAPNGANFLVSGYIPDGGVTETQLNSSVAGNGISGGGGSALALDNSELSAGSAVGSGDLIAGYDGTNSVTWTISQIGSWLAGDNITVSGDGRLSAASSTTFTLAGDTGSSQTISDGDTMTMTGGTGINTVAGATDTVTYNLDLGSLNGAETTLQIADSIAFVDSSDSSASKRITFANFSNNLAGDGLTNGGGAAALDVNAGAGLEVVSDAVRIATSAAGVGLTGGGGSALALDFTELTDQSEVTSGDIFVGLRGTDESQWTIDEMASRLAGPGISVSGDGIMTVTGGDFSGATLENITATDTMLYVDAGDSETKRSSLTALADILTDGSNSVLRNDGADIFVDIDNTATATPEWKDKVVFLDGNVANLNQSCTWADVAAEMAGDGLTVDASTMSLDVEVDDSTIEIATDTVQVKDLGITFAKLAAAAVVTEAEGIDNNDNDTTLPTSAAVKDYVDNLSGLSVVTQTAASLTVTTEDVVLCDTSSNAITVTLPENGGDVGSGRRVTVKKTTSDGNTVTISRQTADTIDGATTYVLYSDNESASFVCDGSNWFIV